MKLLYKEKIGNKRIIHILGVKISYKKKSIKQMFRFLKQDKNSQVEFYLIDAFEIFHFLPIYKECLKQGIRVRIVAEPCDINTASTWFDYDSAIKILKENKIDYCTKCNPNAKIAITTQRTDLLRKYRNKKAVLGYGVGLNTNAFGLTDATCIGCDIRFAHGEFQKRHLSNFMDGNKVYIMGYPKYDEFFKNIPDKNTIKKELHIDTNKPIIVYFPTWDEDSSIQMFGEEISKLKEEYFIISKAHHCTFRLPDKKEDLDMLYRISDIVLEGNYPFAKAAMLADIALCDAKSGALTEVPFLNKNVHKIGLSVQDNIKDYFHKEAFEFTKLINNPKDLRNSISDNCFISKISIEEFFKSTYGNDSKVVCGILLKEINSIN